jgi:hypothetical protein
MSVRASLAAVVVVTLFFVGCSQSQSPTSPASLPSVTSSSSLTGATSAVMSTTVFCNPNIQDCGAVTSYTLQLTSVNVGAGTITGLVNNTPRTFTATPYTIFLMADLSLYPPNPIIPALNTWNMLLTFPPNPILPPSPCLAQAGVIAMQSGGTANFALTAYADLALVSMQPVP